MARINSRDFIHTSFHYKYDIVDERKMINNKLRVKQPYYMILQLIWDFDNVITVLYNGVKVLQVNNVNIIKPYGTLIFSNVITNDKIKINEEYQLVIDALYVGICNTKI